jgi:hypothetical protein
MILYVKPCKIDGFCKIFKVEILYIPDRKDMRERLAHRLGLRV